MAGIYNASAKGTNSKPGKTNNASLPNVQPLIQAGIDPKTGLPLKAGGLQGEGFKPHNKKLLRIIDEQDAVNRYTWYNLPNGLNGKLIERVLYYKGQGMFFYMEDVDQFFFLPYSLDGTIDVYGRFRGVTPLPFNGSANNGDDKKEKPWITGLTKKPVYDIHLDELTIDDLLDSCVLLWDYTPQMSQTNISRQILNDPLLDMEAELPCFLHTALLNATGVQGMRVGSEDEQSNVKAASQSINHAALVGEKYIPIIGQIDFQDLTPGQVAKAEEFLLSMQALDNYRLSTYGLENGGLFQKKAQVLQAEQSMNAGSASIPLRDGLEERQRFCDIANSIWGLGIWCEISETAMGMDYNFDGKADDSGPQTPSYESGGEDNDTTTVE